MSHHPTRNRRLQLRCLSLAAFVALTSACTGGSATTTTTSTTTAAPATTTTSTSTTTPAPTSTTAGLTMVGDPDALRELVDDVSVAVLGVGAEEAGVPVPDLTNGDPLVALEAMMVLDSWIGSTEGAPDARWAEVYTAPGSVAETRIAGYLSRLGERDEILAVSGAPWVFHDARAVHFSYLDLTDLELSLADGSVAVAFTTSVGPYDFIDAGTGEVASSRQGWDNYEWTAVLSPGPHGWVFAYVFF